MGRRLLTNIAIAGVLTGTLLIAGMWTIAVTGGHVESVSRHYDVPPEFRPNHGPWSRNRLLSDLHEYALLGTLGLMPVALAGAIVERTRRAEVVMALASLLFLACCAHFPLFE